MATGGPTLSTAICSSPLANTVCFGSSACHIRPSRLPNQPHLSTCSLAVHSATPTYIAKFAYQQCKICTSSRWLTVQYATISCHSSQRLNPARALATEHSPARLERTPRPGSSAVQIRLERFSRTLRSVSFGLHFPSCRTDAFRHSW